MPTLTYDGAIDAVEIETVGVLTRGGEGREVSDEVAAHFADNREFLVDGVRGGEKPQAKTEPEVTPTAPPVAPGSAAPEPGAPLGPPIGFPPADTEPTATAADTEPTATAADTEPTAPDAEATTTTGRTRGQKG